MIKSNLKNKQIFCNDHSSSELLTEDSNVTKSEFVTEFMNTIHSNGGSIKLCNEIFHLLRTTFVNSPLNDIVDNCCTLHISKKLSNFISPNNNIIHIDICPNGCMAFFEDTNNYIFCTFCNSRRFTNCSKPGCETASYQECKHLIEERIPIKCIFYIPLIPTLVDFIQTKNFMHYYNFTFNAPLLDQDIYTEAIHGNMSQQNAIPSMKSKGDKFSSKWLTHWAPRNRNDTIETINFLLTYFYDSGQLYKRSIESLSILTVSILNFPSNVKNILGAGTFLISMHTSIANNLAQQVVFRTLFSDELNLLEKGIFIKGTKPNKYGGIENYFLQARVVQHNLDTAALNKNINFEQCQNSYSGCYFCRKFRGKYYNDFGKHIYQGHRGLLPINHVLRKYGQSRKCCPKNFYLDIYDHDYVTSHNTNIKDVDLDMDITENEFQKNQVKITTRNDYFVRENSHYCCVEQDNIHYLINEYNINDSNAWFHKEEFPFDKLFKEGKIYYPHMDFRDVQCGDTISNNQHISEVAHVLRRNLPLYNGCKGPTSLQFVKSVQFNHYYYDWFHVIGNNTNNHLRLLKGK